MQQLSDALWEQFQRQGAFDRDAHAAGRPAAAAVVYECGDLEFSARVGANEVELTLPDRHLILPQVRAASGTKYVQGDVLFWSKGDTARLEIGSAVYPECTLRVPSQDSTEPPALPRGSP
jgi:putative lipoprotein